MYARAVTQIWDDFQKRKDLCPLEKKIAAFVSFQGYKAAQFILNQSACLFYGKKSTNPDAPAYCYNLFENTLKELEQKFIQRKLHYFFGRTNSDAKQLKDILLFMKAADDISQAEFTYYLYRTGPLIISTREIGGHVFVVNSLKIK